MTWIHSWIRSPTTGIVSFAFAGSLTDVMLSPALTCTMSTTTLRVALPAAVDVDAGHAVVAVDEAVDAMAGAWTRWCWSRWPTTCTPRSPQVLAVWQP